MTEYCTKITDGEMASISAIILSVVVSVPFNDIAVRQRLSSTKMI